MNFRTRFLAGAIGAAFGSLAYGLIAQPLFLGRFDLHIMTVVTGLISLAYGSLYAVVHQRRTVTFQSCLACGFSTSFVVLGAALLAAAFRDSISFEFTARSLVAVIALSTLTALGGYLTSGLIFRQQ